MVTKIESITTSANSDELISAIDRISAEVTEINPDDITCEYADFDDYYELTFAIPDMSESLGSWDIDKSDIDNDAILSGIGAELDAAISGIEPDVEVECSDTDKTIKSNVKTEGATILQKGEGDIFKNAGSDWKVITQNDDYTVVVALDDEGNEREKFVVAFGLQPDGSWNQGHYFQNKENAMKFYNDHSEKTESVVVESSDSKEKTLNGKHVEILNTLPEFDENNRTWIRVTYKGNKPKVYYVFDHPSDASETYKAIMDGDADIDISNISDISLGFTDRSGSAQIRWQDYDFDFSANQKVVKEDKEITKDITADVAKLGYKVKSNGNGEIIYSSDVLYSPDIVVFGNIVEIIPLPSDELPISMSVEDHGKLVLRLMQVQKLVETLK